MGWDACPVCGLLASVNRRGGIHERCAAQIQERRQQTERAAGTQVDANVREVDRILATLPPIEEIFRAPVACEEFINKGRAQGAVQAGISKVGGKGGAL